jgi:hypothetical protein
VRCLYVDLDATLLGPGGSLLRDGEGGASLLGVRALEACLRAGVWMPGERTIYEQIADSGAPALLLEHFDGRLEEHSPWHRARDVSHLFRGLVDAFEANELLVAHGHRDLRVIDNGVLAPRPELHAYHLLPASASKVGAVAFHRRARGYAASDCIAVGDSREDLDVSPEVGAFWLVANALERDPSLREALSAHPNARVAEERYGPGVYEAVVTTLAAR